MEYTKRTIVVINVISKHEFAVKEIELPMLTNVEYALSPIVLCKYPVMLAGNEAILLTKKAIAAGKA